MRRPPEPGERCLEFLSGRAHLVETPKDTGAWHQPGHRTAGGQPGPAGPAGPGRCVSSGTPLTQSKPRSGAKLRHLRLRGRRRELVEAGLEQWQTANCESSPAVTAQALLGYCNFTGAAPIHADPASKEAT